MPFICNVSLQMSCSCMDHRFLFSFSFSSRVIFFHRTYVGFDEKFVSFVFWLTYYSRTELRAINNNRSYIRFQFIQPIKLIDAIWKFSPSTVRSHYHKKPILPFDIEKSMRKKLPSAMSIKEDQVFFPPSSLLFLYLGVNCSFNGLLIELFSLPNVITISPFLSQS